MKEITDLAVMELRLFPYDVIPLRSLITASHLKTFTSPFVFKEVEIGEDENHNIQAVKMQKGEFKCRERICPVESLIIEKNRIILKTQSDNEIADQFYRAISKSLIEIDPNGRFKGSNYLVKSYQTVCVVTLDLDYMNIFSGETSRFIKSDALKACSTPVKHVAKVRIFPQSLTFSVNYEVTDKALLDAGVAISPKPLTIEPRMGTSLNERRFYTSSPTDSKTHLDLISTFENLFKKKRAQKETKKD